MQMLQQFNWRKIQNWNHNVTNDQHQDKFFFWIDQKEKKKKSKREKKSKQMKKEIIIF